MKHVIKRTGKSEVFDERKLYVSIYASCLAVHEPLNTAELTAQKVTNQVNAWLAKKTEVTASDIRHMAGKYLSDTNHHAGYLYLHHRIMW
jgi:transcriptional regulator NrdR family protein